MPALAGVVWAWPQESVAVVAMLAAVALWRARRRWGRIRFRNEYVTPTLAAIGPALGLKDVRVDLHVDPGLGQLTPRLAKPLSPAEEWVRVRYGTYLEPILRWLPEHIQRAVWTVQGWVYPLTKRLDWFRRPGEKLGPRIELTAATPYLTKEQRQLVSAIITAKIPVSDLVESWHQVGANVRARWTVRQRPPSSVGVDQLLEHLPRLQEWEFYIGQGAGDRPVILSLKDDSPHIAVSAGTGAGKSVFAMDIAVQVLRRGGQVIILDRKGSHRWARNLDGVTYCTKPAQMHNALIEAAEIADLRNDMAFSEADDWDPGPRILVICEELNATIGMLANYWAEIRGKGDPKKSPAIAALGDLLFMGRSAKVNILAIAQMLTARAIGGPEARENFGIRCLARYTANAWKMLVPEASMPRASRTLGRWQIVIGGVATEVQVAYLTTAEARALAKVTKEPDEGLSRDVTGDSDMMTLQDAIDAGVLPWKYSAARQRLARNVGQVPAKRGKRGKADLYTRSDLERWAASGRR
ncbi:type IV secretory system conjugative DNA transfer family protein [Actinoplanes italicus]|nr:type IV secretory system conjugative DNA transfer family protein [Actinoplanes italicus]